MPLPRIIRASLAIGLLLISRGTLASTITVNTTADTIADDGACTLREAIIAANTDTASGVSAGECAAGEAAPTVDTIAFAIPGAGVHTTSPLSALPTITQPVIIDGYTQPGSSPNTNPTTMGLNTVLTIELSPTVFAGNGLDIAASDCTVRGLVINSFQSRSGIHVSGSGSQNIAIEGNFIGTDPTGTVARPNGVSGVFLENGPSNNTIGGTTPAARNLISGNSVIGVTVQGDTNIVQGNLIGTDITGTLALGNSSRGVNVQSGAGNLVGGTTVAARNIISGNNGDGVDTFAAGSPITVQGNFIGTDVTGTVALPNSEIGVAINTNNNVIGGLTATPGTPPGNLISASGTRSGVQVAGGSSNLIQGNIIGADITATQSLGNHQMGINIVDNGGNPSHDNTIGGTAAGARNIIAFNGTACDGFGTGVSVGVNPGNINNTILGNSIFSNASLGIDLEAPGDTGCGVTPNDHCDTDTGANDLQNYPVITSAAFGYGSVTLSGTLDSVPDTTFRIEFFASPACHPSGFGQGEHFLGSTNVTTGACPPDAGQVNASFGPLMFAVPAGDTAVTATATRLDGGGNPVETSEFSACFAPPTTTTTTTTTVTTTTSPTTTSLPATTTSSTTHPTATTTTTTTAPPSTTTTTTSTTVPATTTSTTTRPSTTSTTQPAGGCATEPVGPTFLSLNCRLAALIAEVAGETDLARLQPKLLDQLQKAKTHKEQAEMLCRQASKRRTRNALRPAINRVSQFLATLGSRKARTIPSSVTAPLRTAAEAIRADMHALQRAVQCPQDAPPA